MGKLISCRCQSYQPTPGSGQGLTSTVFGERSRNECVQKTQAVRAIDCNEIVCGV